VRYRVDSVPGIWWPFWTAYSWIVGLGIWLLLILLNLSCRITLEGTENLEARRSFIYSLWHRFWFLWGVAFVRSHQRHVWMQHPAAYMKPIHIALQLMGVRVLLGSGGEEGQEASRRLSDALCNGWSTAISPDGPYGPPGVLKKGVLHIALQSGVPVLPVRFVPGRAVALPSWDKKPVPLPFSRIRVVFGEPVVVTERNFEDVGQVLVQRMSGLTEG
jgi:lysophospholipid acyltransferase (LPLAT)-like uncharacterized protein